MQNNNYPQISLGSYNDEYRMIAHVIGSYILNNVKTVIPVEVVKVTGGKVNVKPLIALRNIIGDKIDIKDDSLFYNIPVMQMIGSKFKIVVEPSKGDKGLLIACMNDMTEYKQTHKQSVVKNNRHYNFSDGVFLPLDFSGEQTGIEISSGDANLKIKENNITINCNNATINADTVNLGGDNGQAVARVGDSVDLNTGLITSGSSKVKAV